MSAQPLSKELERALKTTLARTNTGTQQKQLVIETLVLISDNVKKETQMQRRSK